MNIYLTDKQIISCGSRRNVADASADNAVRVIIEWLDGDCPHVSHTRARHWCGECYQTIEKLTKPE